MTYEHINTLKLTQALFASYYAAILIHLLHYTQVCTQRYPSFFLNITNTICSKFSHELVAACLEVINISGYDLMQYTQEQEKNDRGDEGKAYPEG